MKIRDAFSSRYEKIKPFTPGIMFLAGTGYDFLTLSRIDRWHAMALLGTYLVLTTTLLSIELVETTRPVTPPKWLQKVWHHREEACHFLLGNLLSAFTVLYFKSSSLVSSLLFFLVIAVLLVGNEFSAMRRLGLTLRMVLYGVCLVSFLACVTPVWWGRIGTLPFLTSITAAALIFGAVLRGLEKLARVPWAVLRRRALLPFAVTLGGYLVCYVLHLIPPVPLSLNHIGIYHNVERIPGGYRVTYTHPGWQIWRHGDQTFETHPGDRIYCFFSIFSPTGFKDSVHVRWRSDTGKGWHDLDTVKVAIAGGREQGYRGFAYKASYSPGDWQVRIETADGREIGRANFTVEPAAADDNAVPTTVDL